MRLKFGMFLIAALLFAAPITKAFAWNSGANCPANYLDMLTWLAPSKGYSGIANYNVNDFANALFENVQYFNGQNAGQIFLVKNASGSQWDINAFDQGFIYSWITGMSSAYNYFEPRTQFPAYPRCVPNAGNGGLDESFNIHVPLSTFATCSGPGNCSYQQVSSNGYAVESVWGPVNNQIGDETQAYPTVTAVNQFDCDSTYHNCLYEEQFLYQQKFGWVYWISATLVNGQYQWTQIANWTYPLPQPNFPYTPPDGNY
jgi:hypothetical protein